MLDTIERGHDAQPIGNAANSWIPHDYAFRDAWHPLAHASSVTKTPVRRSVYSEPYFLWREDGVAVASCTHPGQAEPVRPTAFTDQRGYYPVIERYGYVWGWFGHPGAADPAHLPNVPFLPPDGGLPGCTRGTVRFDCAAPVSVENLLDLTHADFLHANVVGDEKSETDDVAVSYTDETITMVRTCTGKSVAPVMKFFSGIRQPTQNIRQVIHVWVRSNVCLAYGRFTPGDDVPLFHPCVPETRDRTRLDYTMNTTNAGRMFRHVMPRASYLVSRQDSSMTSLQSPRYMQPTTRRDLHSPFDAAGQRYRVLLAQLAKRQSTGDTSYRDNYSADCSDLIGLRKELFRY